MKSKKASTFILTNSLIIGIFLLGTDNLVIGPLVNQISKDINSSPNNVTLGITLYSLAYGFFALFLAPISDIYGRKIIIVISSLFFGITCFGISMFHDNTSFLLFRFLSGVAAAVLGPNLWAYVNEIFEKGKRELVTSWMMSAFNLATVLGVPIGLFVSGIFGWSDMFIIIGILSIVISLLFGRYGEKNTSSNTTFTFRTHFANIKGAFKLNWKLSLSILFASAAYLMVYPCINLWLDKKGGWTISEQTVVFFVIGLTGFIGNIISGFVLQKSSPSKISRIFWVMQSCIIIILFLTTYLIGNAYLFIGLTAIWTFLTGVGNTAFITNVASRAGNIRGSVMALNNSSIFLGFTLGSFLGGEIWGLTENIGFNLLLAIASSLFAVYFLFIKEKKISLSSEMVNEKGA
ncbi:MFS transporter [Rummeliibacillus pycnus]|uniref:MFS transporter n=1 Tax=Rummeliibacillus pycnus TaxID=101070 RepID=UPI0037CBA47E